MKKAFLTLVALGALAVAATPARAQVEVPKETPPKEKIPEVKPPALPEGGFLPYSDCHPPRLGVKVLPVDIAKPITALEPREVITLTKRPGYVIVFEDRKDIINEVVMKPVEVTREVPVTVMKPCTVTDPHTGHCTTVMKPCTEMQLRKETVFYPVAETREVIVKVPFLKEVEELVPQRNVILEWRTLLEPRTYAIAVPDHVLPDRYYVAPHPQPDPPSCPHHP